jgi:predicted outer membrane repeat protein
MVAAGVALAPPEAAAAVLVVDTTADATDALDGLTSLREAFAAANANASDDTIVLSPGLTYLLDDCVAGELEHDRPEALTIEANGATIEQSCPDERIISSTDTSATSVLTVDSATLTGGENTGVTLDGAAIFADGRLFLDDSTITGVSAGPSGSLVSSTFTPGGGPTINVTDSDIVANSGSGIEGDFVSAVVTGSNIIGNVGSGVRLVDGNPLTIVDSVISDNTGRAASTTGQGNTRVSVTDSTFHGNGAGGLSCSACAALDVTGSTITDNGATASAGGGGGITFSYDFDPVPADPGVSVVDSEVTGNQARHAGGGVAVTTIQPASDPMIEPVLVVQNSDVSDNQTLGDALHGGGISARTGSVIVAGGEVSGNEAGVGGAVASRGGGIYVSEDSDDGIVDGRDMILAEVEIEGNEAAGAGGGAYVGLDGRIEAEDVTFSANTSGGTGGGLHLQAHQAALDVMRFEGNTGTRGGGLFADDFGSNDAYVWGSTFWANTATEHGGGISADDLVDLVLTNSTVSGNSAPEGGGISIGIDAMDDPEAVTLRHVTVAANTAPVGANIVAYEGLLRTEASVVVGGIGATGCAVGPGNIESLGHSFVDEAACAADPTDAVSVADPQLGALADNGGATPTHLPAATSPLGGLVPVVSCEQAEDQRGVARPQGAACEPGAVEVAEALAITGTGAAEVLGGTAGDDVISGLGGNDLLLGRGGADLLDGGPGDDILVGGPGTDTLVGGPGFDLLVGTATDVLAGGPGADLCLQPGRWPRDC